MSRRGGFITTNDGRRFWPLDPRPADVYLPDIAHALSHQCRWSGHTAKPYSVGQHTLAVAEYVRARTSDPKTILWALLHDASEAYMVDLPTPLKRLKAFAEFRRVERLVMEAVARKYGLCLPIPKLVKEGDRACLAREAKSLMPRERGLVKTWRSVEAWGELPPLYHDLPEYEVKARLIAQVNAELARIAA